MKLLLEKIILLSVVIFTAQLNFAADSSAMFSLAHQSWQDRDGLPQNTVQAIVQTRDGYLWLGTEDGLARFDGVKFTVFNRNNTPEVKNNYITALFESADGTLWIGTRGGGVIRFSGGKFETFSQKEGLAQDTVRAIGETTDGAVWVGTSEGLSRFAGGNFTTFEEEDGLPSGNIRAILGDHSGNLWIGSTEGIALLKDGKFANLDLPGAISSDNIRTIVKDKNDALWIGTQTAGLLKYQAGKFENISVKNGLSSNYIRALHLDRDDSLWIGTFGGGVNRLKDGVFTNLSVANGLTSEIVRAVSTDREGNVWVGTEGGGLNRFNQGKVRTITKSEGLTHNLIRAVRQMRDGKIWIGTEGGGINIFENGRIVKTFSTAENLSNNFITSIFEDADGAVWVGTLDGLNRIENGRVSRFRENYEIAGSTVWAIEQTPDGAVWIGTAGGLSRWQNGKFTNFTARTDGLPEGNSRVVFADRQGRLWIGSREGILTVYENGKFTVLNRRGEHFDANVSAFHEDGDGTIWIATNNGLIRFRNGKFTAITQKNGLFHDNLHRILEDQRGRFWLTSNGGIFSVLKNDLDAFADGKISAVESKALTAADGMKSSECSGEAQPAGWLTTDETLWIPTIHGVAVVEPDKIEYNILPPPIHIEKVVIEKKTVNLDAEFELAAGVNEIEFHYTALSFVAPEKVRFRYRLEGLEDEWIEAGTRRTAFYTSLPPGRYRFQVIASNNDGVWNETGASFGFYQQPFFYQTWVFYCFCAAAFALLVWLIYKWRVRQIELQFQAVVAERNRIAREWHDTLAAGIAAIAWQLESSLKQFSETPSAARQNLQLALKMVKHSMTEARRVLWDLRSNASESGDLTVTLGESVKQLTSGKIIETDFKVNGTPHELPGDVAGNLLRICQEAVSNAMTHAKAEHLRISLLFKPQFVCLQIADDGCGFDPKQTPADGIGHFGLIGMRERAVKLGGKFDLKSSLGNGTEITVEVKLK